MGLVYKKSHEFLDFIPDTNDVIVEIGSEQGDGSTAYFAQLAFTKNQKFITVDIRSNVICHWKDWYNLIKGSDWPRCDKFDHVYLLPDEIQKELIEKFQFNVDYAEETYWADNLTADEFQNMQYDVARGSHWAKDIFPTYNKKISCLYLDNFRYTWNISSDDHLLFLEQEKQKYSEQGMEMTNLNCQVEHLSQMVALLPLMADRNIVVCNDTYAVNDCYLGKCGPVVVYLLTQGYKILCQYGDGTILGKNI